MPWHLKLFLNHFFFARLEISRFLSNFAPASYALYVSQQDKKRKNEQFHAFFMANQDTTNRQDNRPTMYNNVYIGRIIKQILEERQISVVEFARRND
jgi:hypothetical protein